MQQIADNLWLLRFPTTLLGLPVGRKVTVIRIKSGDLIIHSSAPFGPEDVYAIHALGRPHWLVDATRLHDTFSKQGHDAFPDAFYLVPEDFHAGGPFSCQRLIPPPMQWPPEVEILRLEGMPQVCEHAMIHHPSRTLIVADLIFNWHNIDTDWRRKLRTKITGVDHPPGMSRTFRKMVRDREAFERSLHTLMQWDFDRIIPGHGEVIETGGHAILRGALEEAGFRF